MANPIIFKKGIYCSTAYSYGLSNIDFIDETKSLPESLLTDINGATLTATNGLINNYTLKTYDTTLWGSSIQYAGGTQIHLTYDLINDAVTNNPDVKNFNLLCIPFVNGTQRRYFLVTLINMRRTDVHTIQGENIRYGWGTMPDTENPSFTWLWYANFTSGLYVRDNFREDIFLDCRILRNSRFANLYSLPMTNGDVTLVITWAMSDPFHNPTGITPFVCEVPIRQSDGAYLFNEVTSANSTTRCLLLSLAGAKAAGYGETEEVNGSDQAGEPSEEGGYYDGSFDDSSDPILIPTVPLVGVTNIGMVNVYRVPDGGLRRFGLELFPEFSFTPPAGTGDALTDLYEVIKDFVSVTADMLSNTQANTLINYVIDCHVIPVTPIYTTAEFVKVGGREMSTIAANPVTQDYVDFSCGELNIREYYANFADYLTNAKLYLPFVGFVPVRAEWFQNSHLKVDYRFNVIDGSFVAFVRGYGEKVNNNNDSATVLAQYTGNACVHIPITGANYAQMVSGIIGAAGGIAAGAATGNFIGAAGSALSLIGLHGDIAQSNAYSSSPAFMGVRVPFLLIERPVSNFSENYPHEHGIPSNVATAIGSCTGFVTAKDIHLDGIPCTDEERRLIEAAFNTGVIV